MARLCALSFFFSSRRRHTRCSRDWSSDVCSSDLYEAATNGPREPCIFLPGPQMTPVRLVLCLFCLPELQLPRPQPTRTHCLGQRTLRTHHCLPCREPRKHELQRFACLKA